MPDAEVKLSTIRGTIADAEGDIAALVYASNDRPDLVLYAFARQLAEAGRRVCGLVQFRDRSRSGSPCRVMSLDSWQVTEFARKDGDAAGCRLDEHWLDQMGSQVEASVRLGTDAVIVNRFGPLEASGRGFRGAIVAASETVTPLVIAVPEFEFERWTLFSAGMTVRLDCTLGSVLVWWRRAEGSRAGAHAFNSTVCELIK
jgi:uncharacterized protein DUF2478